MRHMVVSVMPTNVGGSDIERRHAIISGAILRSVNTLWTQEVENVSQVQHEVAYR